jgi:hypothetical protein
VALQQGGGSDGSAPAMDAISVLHEARALLSSGGSGPRGPEDFSGHTIMGNVYPSNDQLVCTTAHRACDGCNTVART